MKKFKSCCYKCCCHIIVEFCYFQSCRQHELLDACCILSDQYFEGLNDLCEYLNCYIHMTLKPKLP